MQRIPENWRTPLLMVAVVVLVVGLVGLGAAVFGSDSPPDQLNGGGQTPSDPETTDTTQQPTSTTVGCVSLENCYGYEEMQAFADQVIPLVERFFDETYKQMSHPAKYVYVNAGDTGTMACTDENDQPAEYNDQIYAYCPADQIVYLGQDSLWDYYSNVGDAGAAVGIAHEWGHHVQRSTGVIEQAPNTQQAKIDTENQADCIAGAWLKYMDEQKVVEYPDDFEDVAGLLVRIADSEAEVGRIHGTLDERLESFKLGLGDGLWECNQFFPNTPIIS